jgi:hypothetical protein
MRCVPGLDNLGDRPAPERDRTTIRAYLSQERDGGGYGDRLGGPVRPPYIDYVRARPGDDPHLWAQTSFDEVIALGYDPPSPTFARRIRASGCGRTVSLLDHERPHRGGRDGSARRGDAMGLE